MKCFPRDAESAQASGKSVTNNNIFTSTTASHCLKEKQNCLGLKNQKLITDVTTRLNSAYDMVERFLEQQPAICATLLSPEVRSLHYQRKRWVTKQTVVKCRGYCEFFKASEGCNHTVRRVQSNSVSKRTTSPEHDRHHGRLTHDP